MPVVAAVCSCTRHAGSLLTVIGRELLAVVVMVAVPGAIPWTCREHRRDQRGSSMGNTPFWQLRPQVYLKH